MARAGGARGERGARALGRVEPRERAAHRGDVGVRAAQRGQPRGVTDAEGRFQLRTYHDGDGAPAGEYTVTLYWPAPYRPNVPVSDQLPPDRLGERFMNPRDSTRRAIVPAGPTTLPAFEIK